MRSAFKLVILHLWLWTVVIGPAANARTDDGASRVLLSAVQGQALADFALQSGPGIRPKPDCSHLVHLLFSRAGLVYPYEGSRVLHRGVPDFERVRVPQPGDLVIWPGHVGIVLSPEDTTFLSSVRSGIITESWTADYWAARGRPRFFRYVVGPKTDLTLLAELSPQNENYDQAGPEPAQQRSVLEARKNSAPRDAVTSQSPALSPPDNDDSEFSSVIAVIHQRGKPDKQDIAAALRAGGNALARQLMAEQRLDLDRPLSVPERLEVLKVKFKRAEGTIILKVSEALTLEHGRVVPGNTMERQLNIDRRDGAWVISDPRRRLYIPREKAVAVFERQAELVLQNDSARSDKRGIIKALNLLYDREPVTSGTRTEASRH